MLRASVLGLTLVLSGTGLAHAQVGYGPSGQSMTAPAYSVQALQRALSDAGYDPGPADGVMGRKTRDAIRQYQADAGLPATGEPSPQLYAQILGRSGAMAGSGAPAQPAPMGGPAMARQQADFVADLQLALRSQGYDIRAINGELNAETRAAIRAFERAQGLPITGEPTPQVADALGLSTPNRNQAFGMRSPETTQPGTGSVNQRRLIVDIQRELAQRGYDVGPVDGFHGPKVEQAIADYERRAGLPVTGQPSPDLLAQLRSAPSDNMATLGGPPGMSAGMSQDEILEAERLLRERGYATGPVDGRLDMQSEEAVRRFQQERGYTVTGMPTRQQLDELRSAGTAATRERPARPEDLIGEVFRGLGSDLLNQRQNSGQ